MHAYFVLNKSALDAGEAKGVLARRTSGKIKDYYDRLYPRFMKELKTRAKENGESLSSSSGFYSAALRKIEEYSQGMGMEFNLIARPKQGGLPTGGTQMPSTEEIEAMLRQANPTQDSTGPK